MTQVQTEWGVDRLGVWNDPAQTTVTAEATVAYAEATNATVAAQRAGEVAPPVYAIVPPFAQMFEIIQPVVPTSALMRVVHGQQDMHFHRPIVPGDVLATRMAVTGIHGAPNGTVVTSKIETTDADGAPVNEQWVTTFFRGVDGPGDHGERAPSHGAPAETLAGEPTLVVDQAFDEDQTYRYSKASGDMMPIHLDDAIAKQVGLPGIIIHGLCTMAFVSDVVVAGLCDGDTARLKRLAVRFSAPNLPGTTMRTSAWAVDGPDGRAAYALQSTVEGGGVVIKDGWAEVGA